MIGTIINILQQDDFHGISEEIEVAKGKNRIPQSLKEGFYQIKRKRKYKI